MLALVDGDILCYRAGFAVNGEDQEALACWQVGDLVHRVVANAGCDEFKVFLSGGKNFRYNVYPQYKGNREQSVRPRHLQAMKQFLIKEFSASVSDGIEADDDLGIAQYSRWVQGQHDSTIITIDKDLLMIPGKHYNFVKDLKREQSEDDAMRHFFWQLIMGDRADNIPGFDGKMRNVVPKKLEKHIEFLFQTDRYEAMLVHVYEMFNDNWHQLHRNAQCLWMQRMPDDSWLNWQDPEVVKLLIDNSTDDITMEDYGQPADLIPLSRQSSEVGQDAGDQSSLV